MTRTLLRASILLLLTGCSNAQESFASAPEVIAQRSAFDYPPNFLEQYALEECHTSPLAVPLDLPAEQAP